MQRNAWRTSNWQPRMYKVSAPCMDHQFRDELVTVELPKVCSKIVLTCLYSARIDRHFLVGKSPGKNDHQMEQSVWQTLGLMNFLHPFHNWLLPCGRPLPPLPGPLLLSFWDLPPPSFSPWDLLLPLLSFGTFFLWGPPRTQLFSFLKNS